MDRLGSVWRLFLISSVIWIPSSFSRPDLPPRYETAYACEGKILKIDCGEGERIQLIRANYGRFSITICNDHGNTDWSVNCMSHKSLRVLHNRCTNNQNCSIPASTSMFGDPCVGTLKYLEAHYQCVTASTTTTTSRPSPPWLMTSQPPTVWSTLKATVRPPVHITTEVQLIASSSDHTNDQSNSSVQVTNTNNANSNGSLTAGTSNNGGSGGFSGTNSGATNIFVTQQPPLPALDDYDDITDPIGVKNVNNSPLATISTTSATHSKTTSILPEVPINEVSQTPTNSWFQENNSCSPVSARNLHWNWTRIGERIVQSCPGGATGLARWRCVESTVNHEPIWSPATPDLSECRSVWLTSLESRINEGDALIAITGDLASVTSSKTLYGGDMMITTKIIGKMAQKMASDIKSFPDARQRETIVTELLSGVVRTGSNLLDSLQHPSWKDLGHKEQMQVATSLLTGLEENAFLLADTVVREKTVTQTVKNIMLSVRVLETHNIGEDGETFPRPGSTNEMWSVSDDWVKIPRTALRENSEGGLVRLVFMAFDRLEEILEWNAESYDTTTNISRILNSKVISASLGKGRHIEVSKPVQLSLRHIKTENVSNPSCVFWDYIMNAWSGDGCRVESTNLTHTICECKHLTNFAILMDVHMTSLSARHQIALQIISYIGCIISIICLILAIITFHSFKGLKSDRTTIHKNLCFCLLVAETLFVAGVWQTGYPTLCSIVAGLLQLFFLCAFAWMFLEGFQLYVMLVEVFEAEKSRANWYYLFAYGLPILIVSTAAGIDPSSYGTPNYCWLRADHLFIFTFITPVVLVILTNLIFLSMAIFVMCRHANASISMKSKEHSRLANARVWLRGAVILVFLLGLTWVFGLFYINEKTITMAYIFTILNSLQGLFIFMFHCVQNEKVRKEYRKLIRRHSWLPKMTGGGSSSSDNSRGGGGSRTVAGLDSTHVATGSNNSKDQRGGSGTVGTLYTAANGSPAIHSSTLATSGVSNNSNGGGGGCISSDLNSENQGYQYSLQRGWSSRSCNTIGGCNNDGNGNGNEIATTNNFRFSTSNKRLTNSSSSNERSENTEQAINNLDNNSFKNLATATLPYIKNSNKNVINNCSPTNDIDDDPNLLSSSMAFPKSATTWGPLNKTLQWKNISSKSYSRDSGHGGSEQENSPRSYNIGATSLGNVQNSISRHSNVKELNYHHRKQPSSTYLTGSADECLHQYSPTSSCSKQSDLDFYQQQQLQSNQQLADLTHQIQQLPRYTSYSYQRKKTQPGVIGGNTNIFRTVSPWNHTYTEIHDNNMMGGSGAGGHNIGGGSMLGARLLHSSGGQNMLLNDDPVYEEIDRNEIQVSDMSDEDGGRRQSDMSRQSSRSYGDHRPLIPYSPAVERNNLIEHRLGNARSLAAVLDGETVVCHLEPPELYTTDSYSSRTVVLPPYTEC